jgi:hypothetical protein
VQEVAAACREHNVELALGGAGKWPDDPPAGQRFRAFEPFYRFALETRGKMEGEG